MMQYLTFDEYVNIGGTLDLTAFARHIDRVCGFIDANTQNRLRGVLEPSQAVKACVRDCVEHLAENASSGRSLSSKSQSAGGVSESESYTAKTADDVEAELLLILRDYLTSEKDDCGTPLLYRGAMR